MRLSNLFMPTRKEDPADAEIASHKLLIRAGYIRMVARGIYSFLPLGLRSMRKIERIVREEMERAGVQEILMPGMQPAELWQETGRWQAYGKELMRFKDRKGSDFVLGPTHEEVITDLIRQNIASYKQLPVSLYQIQTKFRDELRPRFGLMRGREFVMKDAYSFDLDAEGANASYQRMFDAYRRIFDRFGFDYRAVEADTGSIGGSLSHEFQVLAETGEDLIASCPESGYAANVEKAEIVLEHAERDDTIELLALEEVTTPKKRTIEEVASFLDIETSHVVKTLIFLADEQPVAVLMRGDHSVNEIKLAALLKEQLELSCHELALATDDHTAKLTKAPVGFAGPINLATQMPVVADLTVKAMSNVVVGANKKDLHYRNANHGRDFEVSVFGDLRMAQPGDLCAKSGKPYEFVRGIEVGHIFYLGTKYSEAMGATLQGEDGKLSPVEMGCYGIGITRILAAAAEQNHDKGGIIWPMAIAPYHVTILPLQMRKQEVAAAGEQLYEQMKAAGIEVMLDDRDLGAGGKFKDADLIGIPLRVAIGARGLADNKVEFKRRAGDKDSVELIDLGEIVSHVQQIIASELGQ